MGFGAPPHGQCLACAVCGGRLPLLAPLGAVGVAGCSDRLSTLPRPRGSKCAARHLATRKTLWAEAPGGATPTAAVRAFAAAEPTCLAVLLASAAAEAMMAKARASGG